MNNTLPSYINGNSNSCVLPQCKECSSTYYIVAIIVIVIILKYLYIRFTYGQDQVIVKDTMNVKVFDFPYLENCCSWWPISHFILFAVLGFFFPKCWLLLIGMGILWELFEMAMKSLFKQKSQPMRLSDQHVEYSDWWSGSWKDIIFNVAGIGVGVGLRKISGI